MAQPRATRLAKLTIFLIIILFAYFLVNPAFSEDVLKGQASEYRLKGYKAQRIGALQEALSCYQKALMLDPAYACVYNDLGVLYEMLGDSNAAESAYLKVLTISPGYGDAYSNLAMLYEKKGDFLKAADCWLKRINIGGPDDLWVKKAHLRIYELSQIIPEIKDRYVERESRALSSEVASLKRMEGPYSNSRYRYLLRGYEDFFSKGLRRKKK